MPRSISSRIAMLSSHKKTKLSSKDTVELLFTSGKDATCTLVKSQDPPRNGDLHHEENQVRTYIQYQRDLHHPANNPPRTPSGRLAELLVHTRTDMHVNTTTLVLP